jgi:hypothetical protein
MAGMEELTLVGERIARVPDDGVNDALVELALLHYGTEVADRRGTHYFPPYLQIIEESDGDYLWWVTEAFEADEPDAGVLYRHKIRGYIAEVEGENLAWL